LGGGTGGEREGGREGGRVAYLELADFEYVEVDLPVPVKRL